VGVAGTTILKNKNKQSTNNPITLNSEGGEQ
jgi:hypothetical protein